MIVGKRHYQNLISKNTMKQDLGHNQKNEKTLNYEINRIKIEAPQY
jgi:hypothetical protein